jgi:hypothetical protein
MAYPTVNAPYGLRPINSVDGKPYAGATRQLPIAGNYNTAIYYGDIVALVAGGTIALSAVTTDSTSSAADYTYGVFMGCQYVNSQGQTVQAQYYPGTAVSDAIAYIVDDPMAAFKVAVITSGNVVSTVTNASVVGTNLAVDAGAGGSTTTGNSSVGALQPTNSAGAAAALPLRCVEVVTGTSYVNNSGDVVYPEIVVKLNNPQITRPTAINYVA